MLFFQYMTLRQAPLLLMHNLNKVIQSKIYFEIERKSSKITDHALCQSSTIVLLGIGNSAMVRVIN